MQHKRRNLVLDCFYSVGSGFLDNGTYLLEYFLYVLGEAGDVPGESRNRKWVNDSWKSFGSRNALEIVIKGRILTRLGI
jgi:hypothetical protein